MSEWIGDVRVRRGRGRLGRGCRCLVESHSRVQGRGRLGGLWRDLWDREGRSFLDPVGRVFLRWIVWRGMCAALLQKTGGVSACTEESCCCITCHDELVEACSAMRI